MTEGPDGALTPDPNVLLARLETMSELRQDVVPGCSLLQLPCLIDSSDMEPNDWTEMAAIIEKYYYDYDGFVVIHGTDTMAYTASALSFLLENLAKPVILTGSQLPLTLAHGDARRNLVHAIMFAAMDICEVCICFNSHIFRGNRSVKTDIRSFNAFLSPNMSALASVGVDIRVKDHLLMPRPRGRFSVNLKPLSARIAVIYMVPGYDLSFLSHLSGYNAVIFVLYGSGNAPQRKEGFIEAVQALSKDCILVACSQCQRGEVNLDKYEVGVSMRNAGLISVFDMTIEATITKLYYLFSLKLTNKEVAVCMTQNLRGEVSFPLHSSRMPERSKL